LITTGLSEKMFSTGIDLNFITTLNQHETYNFIGELIRLFGRLLAFSLPTIALINGHAIAGGCMLAFAHDYRIMNTDIGRICLNEVELGAPLPPGMNAVVQCKVSPPVFRDIVVTAKRFDAKEAYAK
jgi:enoyl-CoA hydratase/carnithine racemase